MEINAINQLRRAAAWTPEKKTDVPADAASRTAAKADSLSVTERTVASLAEQNQRLMNLLQQSEEDSKVPAPWDMLYGTDSEASGDSEADALGEQLKTAERCQKIAARIMRGDKVPPQDERYLMENDPDGYKLALAMRTPKKKPKEWKSVLEDEKKEESSEETGEAEETSSCEASEGASDAGGDSGGGDAPSSGE